jgi:hypothetical protein
MGSSKVRKFQKDHLNIKILLLSFFNWIPKKFIARVQGLEFFLL